MEQDSNLYIDEYIARARKAQKAFERLSQEKIDEAVMVIAKTVYDNAEYLAEIAVEETGMGVVSDKIAKNKGKARIIWHSLKGKKTRGIIERDEITGITKIAKPMGVVAAITPTTNPIVTPMGNSMFALKGGNAIIITPHHRAFNCSTKTVEMMNAELEKIGVPEHLIQILDQQSRENTRSLISKADVVIATGGMGMVKAAYSSGKPALGVGAGNVQCIIDTDVDIEKVASLIIAGRTFDNGIICAAEQSIILPKNRYEEMIHEFEKQGAYMVKGEEEKAALRQAMFVDGAMNRQVVGQSVETIAQLAQLQVPKGTKVLIAEADGIGKADLFSKEKMCPVLVAYSYETFEEAVSIAAENLEAEGKGHSVSIHSNDKDHIEYAGRELSVSRFVINQNCALSAGGSFYNGLAPTNTLGCGSWGNNSISENLDYKHLINVSRIAYHIENNSVPTDEELWRL
jgi:succinate-semialdehyde dehydrogenase